MKVIFFVILLLFFTVLVLKVVKDQDLVVFVKENPSTASVPEIEDSILTLEQIFTKESELENLPPDKVKVLIATGDIIPARSVNYQAVSRNNFRWSFEKTADILKSGDLTLVNLEAPLIPLCPVTQEGMIFCGDIRHIEGLEFAGIDVVNLANNHAGNYGEGGIRDTVSLLEGKDILPTGLNGPVFKEVSGKKFAFLGYNDIGITEANLSPADEEKICLEVKDTKEKSDIVIPSFHWGIEYVYQPNERQRQLAHLAVDCGADLVIGNHPHWIQPLEIYQGKVITYAHGNFIFDQEWSQKTKEGVVGRYTFFDNKLVDVKFFPVKIENYGQPYFLEGEQKDRILNEMYQESIRLADSLR